MRHPAFFLCSILILLVGVAYTASAGIEEDVIAFAVVSELPKDRTRVPAKVAIEGSVTDMKLLASDHILSNLAWKQLEICHALKLEGQKSSEGFRIHSLRAIDGAMLPMVLQGYAGDCLLKKALEMAPFVD
ncbi:MAG: hypothetical protein OEV27_09490 [Nitrospira sp.]|nr:hypothetical protein [Nitrospira sp.]MDH4251410.1 hypothetical protein [Nitrospira sp.]MDH4343346.1 hypothetical protein [Nitrospira sp.]MDH5336718.1 hypothetical protein [Nitrospira sp.]